MEKIPIIKVIINSAEPHCYDEKRLYLPKI